MARHGENIRKRADGRWEGRYKVFDEARGKYTYRSLYGRDYGEVKEKLFAAKLGTAFGGTNSSPKAAGAGGQKSAGGDPCAALFSQAAGSWLSELSGKRKYSTYIKYDAIYRTHLADVIGSCQLCGSAEQALREKILDHLSTPGLSVSLQKSILCVANQIIAFANSNYQAELSLLERLPAEGKKKAAETFFREEQAMLLHCIYKRMDKFRAAVLLCLYTGLRLGELCALRWTDIDLDGRALTVNRTVQRIAIPGHTTKTALMETDPKSQNSKRTIPVPPELLEILCGFKKEQPYVFGGQKPLEPRTMQYRFKEMLKEAGVSSRTFHTLRHTFATNCVENSMDIKALSELLGHSDVKITLNRYVHPTMDSKRKQIGALADFYGQICGRVA